jgi:hypothetical protein
MCGSFRAFATANTTIELGLLDFLDQTAVRHTTPQPRWLPRSSSTRSGQLAPAAATIFTDPIASRALLEVGYEDPAFLSGELTQAFVEPVIGTPEAAERFQEPIAAPRPADLSRPEPRCVS